MNKNKMDKYKALEYIANGIHAANKIQDVYKSTLHRDSNTLIRPDNFTMLNQVLQILTEHSPEIHKRKFEEALSKSSEVSNTYRNLKRHFKVVKNQRMNKDLFLETLSVLKPIVDNRRKAMIDKAIRIHEILNS